MLVAGCPLISAMMQASKDLPFAISRKTSPPPIVTPSTMAAAMTILVACTGMSLQRLSIWRPYADTTEAGSLVRAPQDDYRRIGSFLRAVTAAERGPHCRSEARLAASSTISAARCAGALEPISMI